MAVGGHGLGLGFQITGYRLLERKLELEAGEAQEVAIVGAKSGAVFDGEGCEVSIND
jgi:hypothetical protein